MSSQAKASLLERFAFLAADHDVALSPEGRDTLRGELEVSLGRWMIGGHSIRYRCWCRLDEAARIVTFRESTTETSWGVPPPTVTVERRTKGSTTAPDAKGARTTDGGGRLDYAALRERFADATRQAGWEFRYEAGEQP